MGSKVITSSMWRADAQRSTGVLPNHGIYVCDGSSGFSSANSACVACWYPTATPPTSCSSLSESNRGTVVIMVMHDLSDIVLFALCCLFPTITPLAVYTHITLVLSQITPHTLIPMDLLKL